MPLDLVCAGNLLVDDVVCPDGRTHMGEAGGAMLYTALGANLWNARVGIVSVAGSDYPLGTLAALEARGVDLGGVRKLGRPGVRTWLLYEKAGRRELHQLERPSHVEVSPRPDGVPDAYRSARALHLSPMPLECQRAFVHRWAGRSGTLISLDPHEPVREQNLDLWLEVLEHVDAFFAGEDELRLEGVAEDPRAALGRLARGRTKLVAFKRGAAGGLLYDRAGRRFIEWSGHPAPVADSTGAGDAFAGGFLAGLLAGSNLETALQQGAVSASFATDDWGAHALLAATSDQAERRRVAWFGAKAGV
jgi:sugar/nucleoside kinase (ribokinase family)